MFIIDILAWLSISVFVLLSLRFLYLSWELKYLSKPQLELDAEADAYARSKVVASAKEAKQLAGQVAGSFCLSAAFFSSIVGFVSGNWFPLSYLAGVVAFVWILQALIAPPTHTHNRNQ